MWRCPNRDAVAAVDISGSGGRKVCSEGILCYAVARPSYFGAEPDALAVSGDGSKLYAANMGSDAVAVIDTKKLTAAAAKQGMVEPVGFIPTEWMPTALASAGDKLYIATAKGRGTGPNNFAQRQVAGGTARRGDFTYVATLLYGSPGARSECCRYEGGDRRGAAVEPDEGGGGEDCVCGWH